MKAKIPYPAVFHDWNRHEERVATSHDPYGVVVEMYLPPQRLVRPIGMWKQVTLTERDACLLAAALLENAGRRKLSRRVLRKLAKEV